MPDAKAKRDKKYSYKHKCNNGTKETLENPVQLRENEVVIAGQD